MLGRIFAAPISDFLSLDFSIFCVLAGVDELKLEGRCRGFGEKISACSSGFVSREFFVGLYFISKLRIANGYVQIVKMA